MESERTMRMGVWVGIETTLEGRLRRRRLVTMLATGVRRVTGVAGVTRVTGVAGEVVATVPGDRRT
jgi:hypothetical protein